MYFYCFICNLKLSELEQLFIDLKYLYYLKSNGLYTCTSICNQRFHYFGHFQILWMLNNDLILIIILFLTL